jgi:hypothetical protein
MSNKNLLDQFILSLTIFAFSVVGFQILVPVDVFAQPADASSEKKDEKKVEDEEKEDFADFKRGQVLSSQGNFKANTSVSGTTSGAVPGDDKVMPVSVSANRSGETCNVNFSSNSEKSTYSVGVSVKITDPISGRTKASRSLYATLAPGSSSTKSFKCPEGNISTQLLKGTKK